MRELLEKASSPDLLTTCDGVSVLVAEQGVESDIGVCSNLGWIDLLGAKG